MARQRDPPELSATRRAAGPAAIALLATAAALGTLAPQAAGPGVTCDELFNVATGKRLVHAFRHQGLRFFAPANIERNFPFRAGGPPMHPPLAMWILGWTHHLFDPAPDDLRVVSVTGARFAPAVALGLLALLIGLWTTGREGPVAGAAAAAGVVLVPRVFAHGHLAGLDLITAVFFIAAVLAVAEATCRGGRWWHWALAGGVWGLAMLTRLHGLLLLPPVAVWVAWRLGRKAIGPLAVWGAAGVVTFAAGWPWLWLDPIARLRLFLGTATARPTLHVFYAGQVWADRDVPWHYPFVMFVVALPVGLLGLGLLGLWAKRRPAGNPDGFWLVAGTWAFLLGLFAWPGTPVYDGVRLFLMVFPLWAVFVGVGAKWVVEHAAWRSIGVRPRVAVVGLFLAVQGVPLVLYHPCQLSHYSLLVGGLRGAERLGFEVTYWGDAVTERLLAATAAAAPGEPVLFGPNLAPFQAPSVEVSSPALVQREVRLVGWDPAADPAAWAACRYGVFYHRRADLGRIPAELLAGEVVAEHEIQGVWLARLVRFREPAGQILAARRRGPVGAGAAAAGD